MDERESLAEAIVGDKKRADLLIQLIDMSVGLNKQSIPNFALSLTSYEDCIWHKEGLCSIDAPDSVRTCDKICHNFKN